MKLVRGLINTRRTEKNALRCDFVRVEFTVEKHRHTNRNSKFSIDGSLLPTRPRTLFILFIY